MLKSSNLALLSQQIQEPLLNHLEHTVYPPLIHILVLVNLGSMRDGARKPSKAVACASYTTALYKQG